MWRGYDLGSGLGWACGGGKIESVGVEVEWDECGMRVGWERGGGDGTAGGHDNSHDSGRVRDEEYAGVGFDGVEWM